MCIFLDKLNFMDLQEFETYYREEVAEILNQLQSVITLSHEVEGRASDIGRSIQNLSQVVETFITEQRPSS